MQDRVALETFIKSSSYTSPQYIKRLKFIFSAICQYAQSKNKSIEEHCQCYTRKRFLKMLSEFSFSLKDFGKSDSILAIFETRRGPLFGKADIWLADILPWWLASGWYFVFEAE